MVAGTRFQCRRCGKLTAGRMPRDSAATGDTSFRFPRRHSIDGEICPGVFEEADWVDTEASKDGQNG
jgi:hypothetical protein